METFAKEADARADNNSALFESCSTCSSGHMFAVMWLTKAFALTADHGWRRAVLHRVQSFGYYGAVKWLKNTLGL
jgi:hypothetical protein